MILNVRRDVPPGAGDKAASLEGRLSIRDAARGYGGCSEPPDIAPSGRLGVLIAPLVELLMTVGIAEAEAVACGAEGLRKA